MGFTKSKANSNLYYKVEEGNLVILLLYVDDLFVTRNDVLTKPMARVKFEYFKEKLGVLQIECPSRGK